MVSLGENAILEIYLDTYTKVKWNLHMSVQVDCRKYGLDN